MTRLETIEQRLQQALQPSHLEVIDQSAGHKGHGGYNADGSHFMVRIASPQLDGLRPVQQHQKIYAPLQDMLDSGAIHALAIEVL